LVVKKRAVKLDDPPKSVELKLAPLAEHKNTTIFSGVSKSLTIAGLLLVAALGFPIISVAPAQPHSHTTFSDCCCADQCETLPPVSCGCRTCPVSTAAMPLIADFAKARLPIPAFDTISWKSSNECAEERFTEPPTPPPRIAS